MSLAESPANETSVVSAWVMAVEKNSIEEILRCAKNWSSVHSELLEKELQAQYANISLLSTPVLPVSKVSLRRAIRVLSEKPRLESAIPVIVGFDLINDFI